MLKRRGYVRQDEESARYSLTLKMLDLSFRALGGSELRLHAYPLSASTCCVPGTARSWPSRRPATSATSGRGGPDEVAMRTVFGREMPAHCALYFDAAQATTRRLSCLKLSTPADVTQPEAPLVRLGPAGDLPTGAQRLVCTCAPIRDYTTQEVGRVGRFAHGVDERPLASRPIARCWNLAGQISLRLGYLPPTALEASA